MFRKLRIGTVLISSVLMALSVCVTAAPGSSEQKEDSAVLDTGDADSVRQMINALEEMRKECQAAVSAEENVEDNGSGEDRIGVLGELREGEWITLDQAVCVRVPADERNRSYVYVMLSKGTDASVIWKTDRFSDVIYEDCWYLSKGQLLGCQKGIKDGEVQFAGILPQWKEERRGETLPLFGNGYISEGEWVSSYAYDSDMARYYQERAASIMNPQVPGPLESVDIRLEKMADQTDLEDASSVASYIRELDWMKFILSMEEYESVAETELEERIVDLPIPTEGSAAAYKTRDGRGGVINRSGGDAYRTYFIFDKELIGLQAGTSDGYLSFATQLPQWKDDETSMDVPLVGDNPMQDYEKKISWESEQQSYADIIELIWPDSGCGDYGNWVYATVHGVVHYDSSSCLTLRDCPNGNVMYTDAGKPMGWQNGDSALIQPGSRQGDWVRAKWNGCLGWKNAIYLWY